MKRSRLALGVTTALLSIAGVTVAKYNGPSKARLYITHGQTACLEKTGISCVTGGNRQCSFITTGGSVVTLYTDGPVGVKTFSNCSSRLLYHSLD